MLTPDGALSSSIRHPSSVLRPPTSVIWRLRVTFAGNLPPRHYLTPDVRFTNPGWDSEEFNRQIEQLEFFLPTGHKIVLAGMEAYNFFIEATQALSGKGGARIEAFWLCGKLPSPTMHEAARTKHEERSTKNEIEMWRIGYGQVVRMRKPWGREWGGTATRGWKLGLVGAAPFSMIVRAE